MSTHPILPGFHPDPSVCRVGADYYLATSSFEYFPGIPIFHSRDLVGWEQIGNVLDRPSQLNVAPGPAGAGAGVYAPTLRHHDGVFYLATTNVTDLHRGHLIVHTDDPAGDWSDPVYTEGAVGIDPDLSWDASGTCHLTWSMLGIMQAAVDPDTGRLLCEPREMWSGTGLSHPEGPHVFFHDGWWYLVIAEGGTGRGHCVSVARSRSATGPFEGHPANPFFSHRSTEHPVQNAGHADLVEGPDGRWAMVHLGVRTRGAFPRWHVNGRETFLTGIRWADGWPVADERAFEVPAAPTSFTDEFTGGSLHPRWIAPGVDPRSFVRHEEDGAVLSGGRAPQDREARRLLAVRVKDADWQVEAAVPRGDAALTVRVDDAHWAAVERVGGTVSVRVVIGPLDQIIAERTGAGPDAALAVRATSSAAGFDRRNGPDRLAFGLVRDGELDPLAEIDGRYLSTEVAGGFTGRVVGVEALHDEAVLSRFRYLGLPAPQ
ncbi:glycoside hydrolase family 43 protein [Actinocorallia aurea]